MAVDFYPSQDPLVDRWNEINDQSMQLRASKLDAKNDFEEWRLYLSQRSEMADTLLAIAQPTITHLTMKMKRLDPDNPHELEKWLDARDARRKWQGYELACFREIYSIRAMQSPGGCAVALYKHMNDGKRIGQAWDIGRAHHVKYFEQPTRRTLMLQSEIKDVMERESRMTDQWQDPINALRSVMPRDLVQEAFIANLEAVYGRKDAKGRVWDVVLHRYYPQCDMRTVNIVPHYLGEHLISSLFHKPGNEVIWDIHNGLLLQKDVATALENGQIVVVPVDEPCSGQCQSFRVFVVDEDIGGELAGNEETFGEIHGNYLDFKGSQWRPAREYLFFAYVVAISLQTRKHDPHRKVLPELTPPVEDYVEVLGKAKLIEGFYHRKIWKGCSDGLVLGGLRRVARAIAHNDSIYEMFDGVTDCDILETTLTLAREIAMKILVEQAAREAEAKVPKQHYG